MKIRAKIAAKKLTAQYEETGSLPAESPLLEDRGVKLFADQNNVAFLKQDAGDHGTLEEYLAAHLNRLKEGDYFAILAYTERSPSSIDLLQEIRTAVRNGRHTATCAGFGPRFLHSTGQVYKGGPNSGVFLQVTCDDAEDIPVPEQNYSFGIVKAAQAGGDLQVLAERGRRVLRVHLESNVEKGLKTLRDSIVKSL